jgi:FkbM family methyltransferase
MNQAHMSVNHKLKLYVFGLASSVLPAPVRRMLGKSSILRPLRDAYFRPAGVSQIVGGNIEFERFKFFFSAPYQTFLHAKRSGIESVICRLIISECRQGSVCIDVGANYGFITTIMALATGEDGVVLSFEPVAAIYRELKANIAANQLDQTCRLLPLAAGCSTDLEKNRSAIGPLNGFGEFATLDQVFFEHGLDHLELIKVDVDGGDYAVLLGAKQIIERFHPILIVEMESHHEEIYELIKDSGYAHILDMQGNAVVPGDWPPNLIAATKDIKIPSRGGLVNA